MLRMRNTVRDYAWGSRVAIAALQGRPPASGPEAELWMGAHPGAPSDVELAAGWTGLDRAIETDPATMLGAAVAAQHGSLPFLVKVLAAAQPLSLQAHPNATQARAGFEAEERAGIPVGAPHRNYRDPRPKPELVVALGRFDALCGFREIAASAELLRALDVPALAPMQAALDRGDLESAFRWTLDAPKEAPPALAAAVPTGPEALAHVHELAERHPDDRGLLGAALLNRVTLSAGQALFLDAGNLHAYLEGTAVEIMGNSDNVLRGGLTVKHVDPEELASVLRFEGRPVRVLEPHAVSEVEATYDTPAEEFELSRLQLGETDVALEVRGPEVLLCVEGTAQARGASEDATFGSGESIFVPGSAATYEVRGPATVFRATVPA